MPFKIGPFYNNRLYELLSNQSNYSNEQLQQLNALLHEEPDLAELNHPDEGSYFHIICRNSNGEENIAFRMIYALSNAGADPNVTNAKGNTPLHEALIRGFPDNVFDLIQALFRIGIDPRIVNHEGKTADGYLGDNPQLTALYKGYGEGIWAAVEASNEQETERLVKGFIKVDCKHNSNKSLLDKARDLDFIPIIHILADYQVTIEFLHSIFACDWDRASLIYKHENEFLKINLSDSIHILTYIRTTNRTCAKSILEYCLDTHSSRPFEILFSSPIPNLDVNVLCTDGLPFFFHCFDENMSNEIRKYILFNSNMYRKSSKGETFLFHLIRLYCQNEKDDYLNVFINILRYHPLLISQRNEQERTIVEEIELTSSSIYNKLRPFYEAIMNVLTLQLQKTSTIEQFMFYNFGFHLLTFFKNKKLKMTKQVFDLLRSLKLKQGLTVLMSDLLKTIADDDYLKLKDILKKKLNIYHTKDCYGRTCAHLAVLHQRYNILKFICDNYNNSINTKDNLNRTSLHYACIMNDRTSIEILEQANAKKIIDCMNLYPNDYTLNRDLCCEEFHAQEFLQNELQRKSSSKSDYLKLTFYSSLKRSIENDAIETIQLINTEIIQMGFHLKDFDSNSYLNDYVQGQRYVPLLFLALERRSVATVQCLLQLGIPVIGRMHITKSSMDKYSRWILSRPKAEEVGFFDINDIINDLEDDNELKGIFKQHAAQLETIPNATSIKIEQETDVNSDKLSNRQSIMKNLFHTNEANQSKISQSCIVS